jgi:hypothetical protein
MNNFTQYSISDTDRFDVCLYPHVASEIEGLHAALHEIKSDRKAAVIISLLKDHSIKTEWIGGNKKLTALLTSGVLHTSHVESLFSSCKQNAGFLLDLESYITAKLTR